MSLASAAAALGGAGLFLLGMRLMTDGLRLAAGQSLRRVLERWTGTRLRAVLSGFFITSLVQSSSAVTIAAIGFVNAGLVTLARAVAVIYGSNVGTTTTGWLVAAIGFHVDVQAFALPTIGIGMAMRLLFAGRRLGPVGEALAGFGVFFLGIEILKQALEGSQDALRSLGGLGVHDVAGALAFVGIGVLLTVVTQSSSAAIALVLTSVGSDVVPLETGACMVIGANVGTTSTAALAVIGATSNAKRTAAAHVAFNGITAVAALGLLPLLLLGVSALRLEPWLDGEPALVLAGFHTLFNLLGVALMWPLTDRMVRALAGRFRTAEEDEGRPRYLDRTLVATPALGIRAIGMELARIGAMAREMAEMSLLGAPGAGRIPERRRSLTQLVMRVGEFVAALRRERIPHDLEPALTTALRVARYDSEVAELAQAVAEARATAAPLGGALEPSVRAFEQAVVRLLEATAVGPHPAPPELAPERLAEVEGQYHELKARLLRAGAEARVPVPALVEHLDRLSNVRRMAEQAERGGRHLRGLEATTTRDVATDDSETRADAAG